MTTVRIRRTDEHDDEIAALDLLCLPPEENTPLIIRPHADCWVALDGGEVVGYAVAFETDGGASYLDRYGVMSSYRGAGLGRRLLRAWLRRAVELRAPFAWTYTHAPNAESGNALYRAGLRMWRPDVYPVGGVPLSERHVLWRREL